jgi:two-component system response regulator ResD
MKGKILIVEDEKKLSEVMSLYLKKEDYEVHCAFDGEAAEKIIEDDVFDLIILDVMMPKKDGWSLLRKIKSKGNTPVILTTARGEEEDRVFGLELGADDYMVKPISMRELILRVGLRINSRSEKAKELRFEKLIILEEKREVIENEVTISLTPKEFDLLVFLCKSPNQVFKREQLLDKVWSYDFFGDTRTVDTHIKNLREKIDFCNKNLKTVWGVGYKIEG